MTAHRRSKQHQLLEKLPDEKIDLTTEVHPMKLTLDSGRLTPRSTNHDLISFLDLRKKYHHELLKHIENHVKDNGYGWLDLLEQEGELSSCARSFVRKYGWKYWGSEENRSKYFYPDAFRDPGVLAIYPARKEEITRVIKIILEKKARNITENQEKLKEPEPVPAAFYIPSPEPVRESPSPILYDNRPMFTPDDNESQLHDGSSKRKTTNPFRTPTPQANIIDLHDGQLTGSSKKIRPFSSIITSALGTPTKRRASEQRSEAFAPALNNGTKMHNELSSTLDSSAKGNHKLHSIPLGNNSTSVSKSNDDPFVSLYLARSYYPERTIFLVRSNRQPDMGPVWVLFRDFSSASSFLEYMARECHPDGYSWAEQQDNKESTSTPWASAYSSLPNVIAATVRLEWSELMIRVRRGKDQDWATLMRELKKAWAASKNPCCESDRRCSRDDGKEHEQQQQQQEDGGEQFMISVMLHFVG